MKQFVNKGHSYPTEKQQMFLQNRLLFNSAYIISCLASDNVSGTLWMHSRKLSVIILTTSNSKLHSRVVGIFTVSNVCIRTIIYVVTAY